MTYERDPTDPIDTPAVEDAAEIACALGEELMPRIHETVQGIAERAIFWSCFLRYLTGAMDADLGHDAAREVVAGLDGARARFVAGDFTKPEVFIALVEDIQNRGIDPMHIVFLRDTLTRALQLAGIEDIGGDS